MAQTPSQSRLGQRQRLVARGRNFTWLHKRDTSAPDAGAQVGRVDIDGTATGEPSQSLRPMRGAVRSAAGDEARAAEVVSLGHKKAPQAFARGAWGDLQFLGNYLASR